jgi:hypothetical protein
MSALDDRISALSEEVVLGPEAQRVSIAEKIADPRLAAERERLYARLAVITADLLRPVPGALPVDIQWEPFVRLRAETLPDWTSPFLAVDEEDLLLAIGRRLFREVRTTLERHYKFEQSWHSVLCALFVMQAHIAQALPATFYLIIKGRYGGGKTSLLNVIAKLGGGLVFENVSVPALARELGHGRLVCIDEYDVRRPAEVQPVMDSIVRQGYRRDAAPYARYDTTKRAVERIPVYGPKALTIRSFLDPALESRGFIISASPVDGEEAYSFVVRNLWSDVGDLPSRLATWAADAAARWPDSRLRAVAESEDFAHKRHQVLEVTGANRDTEQVLVALLVSEMSGLDVGSELRAAVELRRASVGAEDAGDLEDVTEAILVAAGTTQERLMDGSPTVRVWFREVKKEVNRRRDDRKDPPISDRRLSTMLTQAGISESWRRNPRNRVGYDLPVPWIQQLRQGTPNTPNLPDPPVKDDEGRGVRDVREEPPPDSLPPEEDLFRGQPTRTDLARERLGREP